MKRRPDALILVAALTLGYLAYSAPRPQPQPADRAGILAATSGRPSGIPVSVTSGNSVEVATGAPTVNLPQPAGRVEATAWTLVSGTVAADAPPTPPGAGVAASAGTATAAPAPRRSPTAARKAPQPSTRPLATPRTVSRAGIQYGIRLTWYCSPPVSRCTAGYPASGAYGAISPDLAVWRGHLVRACTPSACVVLRIVDCTCQAEHSVDAYASVFRQLAPLSVGTITVTLELVG